jgi:DNA-binding SARP family transcriptional activator
MHVHQHIRVSLLGEFEVVRADGSSVAPEEWRTGKTADLLRLLALDNGRPVRPERLIDKLWPDAAPDRARASLRTACSQVRRAIATNCVVRERGGVVLTGASVDVAAFREVHRRITHAAAIGHHPEVLALADTAEQLYRGDFRAYADDSVWASTEREHLRQLRQLLLCDAARSALARRRHREALLYARTAQLVDPDSEIANRLLMRAHAATGEVSSALRLFESYRTHLAEELGADPSPQTQAVYLHLLRGSSNESA